jgi:hypothetical protein
VLEGLRGEDSIANQSFKLAKPLTYLPVPTEAGYAPSLTIWVDGIEVAEVPTLYGQPPEALVYTLREDDEGATFVSFGDGQMGARLKTNAMVSAQYRSGAGAERPEAGSISQMVAPVSGVTTIHQPFAAFGGSDSESEEALRIQAPRSALLLGRAISLADFEAVAASQNGVDAAQAVWAWSARRQRPVAQVWFAGSTTLSPSLKARLRAMSDPSTAIEVLAATPEPLHLALEVKVAESHNSETVLTALRQALTTGQARLAQGHPKIGQPLFRSILVAEALAIKGVHSLDAVTIEGAPLAAAGRACPQGTWFSIDPALGGSLSLNGEAASS